MCKPQWKSRQGNQQLVASHNLSHLIFTVHQDGLRSIPLLQMGKRRLGEVQDSTRVTQHASSRTRSRI